MILQPATWGELGIGNYLQSPDLQIWRVDDAKQGWLLVSNPRGDKLSLAPQPAETPCTIMVPSEVEAVQMLSTVLGATILGESKP